MSFIYIVAANGLAAENAATSVQAGWSGSAPARAQAWVTAYKKRKVNDEKGKNAAAGGRASDGRQQRGACDSLSADA
ncbi:hypothetical protein GCM10011513_00620 [Franconibacter daqui]|nr:hypothetical protein GCM10011513_00620 [Franconibacter daqui]